MAYLQPYLVFKAEATRLNTLYWTSKYSYTRSIGLLKLIAGTGHPATDPRVDQLWGSTESGVSSAITVPLSEFILTLEENSEALRTTSILHMCSAFENALCGYFSLCCLYQPLKEDPTYVGEEVPELLKSPSGFEARKKKIKTQCDAKLHGKYKKRIKLITDTWSIPSISAAGLSRIDNHYKKRHLIAHDQGLAATDSPDSSAVEIISTRLRATEATWKAMIADFDQVLKELDESVKLHVVSDLGLALSIHRIVSRDGPQTSAELKGKIQDEWRTGTLSGKAVKDTAIAIGLKLTHIDTKRYKVSR